VPMARNALFFRQPLRARASIPEDRERIQQDFGHRDRGRTRPARQIAIGPEVGKHLIADMLSELVQHHAPFAKLDLFRALALTNRANHAPAQRNIGRVEVQTVSFVRRANPWTFAHKIARRQEKEGGIEPHNSGLGISAEMGKEVVLDLGGLRATPITDHSRRSPGLART